MSEIFKNRYRISKIPNTSPVGFCTSAEFILYRNNADKLKPFKKIR